ncbi:MAG: trypsin-like peptidase domain-containing protein [Holosporales bacterium]|jgi:S1-C subfamily serine protease|nr:trypsin-like peptidase domain-containing protein [Holosporales bacterium]
MRRGVVVIKAKAYCSIKSELESLWYGAGFFVDLKHGLIVTNAHIAGEMAVCTYEIKYGNGRTAEAKLAYLDPCYDLAILAVDPKDIPSYCAELKLSAKLPAINQKVFAMGDSNLDSFSVYSGTIFSVSNTLWLKSFPEQSIQFTAFTVGGASGSPCATLNGDVVGILYGGKLSSGAALPSAYIVPVIESIKQGKKFCRYFPGFILCYTTVQKSAKSGTLPDDAVHEYEKEFPDADDKIIVVNKKCAAFCDESEIEAGDIVWKIEGELIGPNLLRIDEIALKKGGSPLIFTVYRHGKKLDIKVKLHPLTSESKLKMLSFAGTVFFETTSEARVNFGTRDTAVIMTDGTPGSPFMEVSSPTEGNYSGGAFQIISINGQKISTLDEFLKTIPSLFKKSMMEVTFTRLGGDGEDYNVVMEYSPKFAEATYYYLGKNCEWNIEKIANPNQE